MFMLILTKCFQQSVCYCACNENLCNVNDPANDKTSCLFGVRKKSLQIAVHDPDILDNMESDICVMCKSGAGAPIRPWLPLWIFLLLIQITATSCRVRILRKTLHKSDEFFLFPGWPAGSAAPSKHQAPPEAAIVPGIPEACPTYPTFINLSYIYIAF